MQSSQIETSPLKALFWKDEILQVLYWMDGEGLGTDVTVASVLLLLQTNEQNLVYHLEKLARESYLKKGISMFGNTPTFSLTDFGKKEAGKRFSQAFQGLQKAGHGECGPDCEFCYGPDGVKLENCVHECGHH